MVSHNYRSNLQGIKVIEVILHQTIANMICTFEVQDEPDLDPWTWLLAAIMLAV
jgi:hypothetical protein